MVEYKHHFICGLCKFKFPVSAIENETHLYSHHCNGVQTTLTVHFDESTITVSSAEDLPLEALDAQM